MRVSDISAFLGVCFVVFCQMIATPSNGYAAEIELKILNYNIQGLPWPIKEHHGEIPEIGRLLGEMRAKGTQPQIVFLQEAFRSGSVAKLIKNSGYNYVYRGPKTSEWSPLEKQPICAGPRSQPGCPANNGKATNSGLYILSDFKITRAQKAAFGKSCTGYDCLSNKGVIMAEVEIPGMEQKLLVLNTHFNSSKSSGSSQEKANASRAKQLTLVDWFMKKHISDIEDQPIIFAGDFNCWPAMPPYSLLQKTLGMTNAQELCLADPKNCRVLTADSYQTFFGSTPDHIFFKSGRYSTLKPISIAKTFKIQFGTRQLSDHLALETTFQISSR